MKKLEYIQGVSLLLAALSLYAPIPLLSGKVVITSILVINAIIEFVE